MKLLVASGLLIPLTVLFIDKPTTDTDKKICSEAFPLLTNKEWKMQEIRFLQDNQPFFYHRDKASESNIDFNDDYIVINCDGSGIYHQSDGVEYNLSWREKQGTSGAIEYRLKDFRYGKSLLVTWEKISLNGNSLTYVEYYTHYNGIESLGAATRKGERLPENTGP